MGFFLGIVVSFLLFLKLMTFSQISEIEDLKIPAQPKNRYPVVFVHGIMPFTGVHKFALHLRKHGYSSYATQFSAVNKIEVRSSELEKQLKTIFEVSGAEKINLIAHSMGGLDARYLISKLGYADKVASLTTIGTPHHGSEIADALVEKGMDMVARVMDGLAMVFIVGSNSQNVDARSCGHNLTTAFAKKFNAENPNHPNVYYQSWSGSCPNKETPFISLLAWSCGYLERVGGANDGLVTQKSSQWGNYRGSLPVDHFQEVNALAAMTFLNDFDVYDFFKDVAKELTEKGL